MYKKYYQQSVILTLFIGLLIVSALSPAYGAIKWSQPPVLDPASPFPDCFWGWDEISIYGSSGEGLWFPVWECATQCHGDADCNGVVDLADMAIFMAAFPSHHPNPPYNPAADFDRDGDVDPEDEIIIHTYMGSQPPRDCPTSPPTPGQIVADDWRCKDERPVTDIHWWGSYEDYTDNVPPMGPDQFHIGIWTDVPAGVDQEWSHPGHMIWEWIVPRRELNERYVGCDFHPEHMEQPDSCFRYDFIIPESEWFYQEGQDAIYWISIAAIYDAGAIYEFPWGWKTRPHFFNDDAVRIFDPTDPVLGMMFTRGEPIEDLHGNSWDMAFELTTEDEPDKFDFGDAPDPTYPTLLASNGAMHVIQGPWLGDATDAPDPEPDGQPDPTAKGDDADGNDDENGVQVPVLNVGVTSALTVTVSDVAAVGGGVVQIWIDWDQSGMWDHPAEMVFNGYLPVGTHPIPVTPPASSSAGRTFLRARISYQGGLPPDGPADDGEVEDHIVVIEDVPYEVKWEQLPNPDLSGLHVHDYGDDVEYTQIIVADDWLCEGGVVTDFHWWGFEEEPGEGLGGFHLSIHASDASGYCLPMDPPLWEKNVPLSDITVTWTGYFYRYDYYLQPEDYFYQIQGNTYWFDLSALSVDPGNACLWIWAEHARGPDPKLCGAAEKILPNSPNWRTIIWGADPPSYSDMAFRVTSDSSIELIDFGDAPDSAVALGYPTLLLSNGARHTIAGPWLGDASDGPDPEGNGQPTPQADGDDFDGNDDENGVKIPVMNQGIAANIILVVSGGGGYVDAWIDWNQDKIWQASDQIHNAWLPDGTHTITVLPLLNTVVGQTYARFRISSTGGLPPDGHADDGEVEDYTAVIELGPRSDLGDAPDSTNSFGVAMTAYPDGTAANYPTVFGAGSPPFGAKHNTAGIVRLGQGVTLEDEADIGLDQDPTNNIDPTGDVPDLDYADDGLLLPVNMPRCRWTTVDYDVNTSLTTVATLYVNIWCDFNRDGDWDDQVGGCAGGAVPEWAVRNQMLVGLPTGMSTIKSLPFVSWHPIDGLDEMWMRITISEQIWQEAWGAGGCGPVNGYAIGETEDYLVVPDTSCVLCADLNCDNFVNLFDFAIFASQWLTSCP